MLAVEHHRDFVSEIYNRNKMQNKHIYVVPFTPGRLFSVMYVTYRKGVINKGGHPLFFP